MMRLRWRCELDLNADMIVLQLTELMVVLKKIINITIYNLRLICLLA